MMFKVLLATLCVALVAISELTANPVESKQQPQAAQKVSGSNDDLPIGNDGSLFLAGNDCGPDERLASGMLPSCEPTCANPRPFCPKIFFSGLDYVPCFCKEPLVRNQQTKQCVQLKDCPPASRNTEQNRW